MHAPAARVQYRQGPENHSGSWVSPASAPVSAPASALEPAPIVEIDRNRDAAIAALWQEVYCGLDLPPENTVVVERRPREVLSMEAQLMASPANTRRDLQWSRQSRPMCKQSRVAGARTQQKMCGQALRLATVNTREGM